MEENKAEKGTLMVHFNNKGLKPFLGVFGVLAIILLGYYFFWSSVTNKMKGAVLDYLKDYKYESVSIGGFPFSKNVKIKNLTFANNTFLATKNQVKIDELLVSSFILSGNLNIKLVDVKTISMNNEDGYVIKYNEDPEINIQFYPDRRLKSFNYEDVGYRVVDSNNKTFYTADKTVLTIDSVASGDTVDYSIIGSLQNMQNISVFEKTDDVSTNEIPEVYNMKVDISTSLKKKDGDTIESIIKISDLSLVGSKNNNLSVSGEILKDQSDPYSYGELTAVITNYDEIMKNYKADVMEALKTENANMPAEEQKQFVDFTDKMFDMVNEIIKKNPETKDDRGVLVIVRKKGISDYTLNGESLLITVQKVLNESTKTFK